MQSLIERCPGHHLAQEHEEASSISCVRLKFNIRILNPKVLLPLRQGSALVPVGLGSPDHLWRIVSLGGLFDAANALCAYCN